MYAASITTRDIADAELALGRPLDWWSVDDCRAIVAELDAIYDPATGTLARALTPDEERFIHDERLRSQLDARYWLERYAWVRDKGVRGGECIIRLWDSQEVIFAHIAHCEEAMWASYERQRTSGLSDDVIAVDGICIALLKARQVGATVLILLLLLHRFIFWSNLREVFASEEGTKTQEAFELYFQFAFDRLPWWMRPGVEVRNKDFGMRCESLDTTLFLQNARQEGGIGMGGTSHCGLITEVGIFPKTVIEQMQNHFFRSIPRSLVVLVVLESLAQGQGNFWHQFSLAALRGGDDAGRWHGVFIPWYVERHYRREPPANWQPSDETLKYAYRVYSTSANYVGRWIGGVWRGEQITLDAYQLYFYESERRKAEKDGALEDFLTNYPATPEEAFQSKSGSPFRADVLLRLANDCREPVKQYEWLDRGMRPADLSILPGSVLGLVQLWEKPNRAARYVIGVDTAPGIENWSRRLPQKASQRARNNAAISVVRIGVRGEPDVQAAQFVAPIDYIALAPIVNWLGRAFRGRDAEMCECVVETGPTSGEALQERLLNEYGYWNLYRKANQATYSYSTNYGWVPTQQARLDLWFRTRPHISYAKEVKLRDGTTVTRVKFVARSRYLVEEEMRNCEADPKLMTAKNAYGFFDDALRACQLALYIAHNWESYGEASDGDTEAVPADRLPDFQASDISREEMIDLVNRRLEPDGGDVW